MRDIFWLAVVVWLFGGFDFITGTDEEPPEAVQAPIEMEENSFDEYVKERTQ